MLMFMWYCRTRGGGRDLRTDGRSFDHKLHSSIRWWAVCMVFSGQLQFGEGVLLILWRYEWKLPWFVWNWGRRKLGHTERESLWKMVGMYSFVWEAFADFHILRSRFLCNGLPVFAFLEYWKTTTQHYMTGCQPVAQTPDLEGESTIFITLGERWPSYTPRHREPILVAFYNLHGI